MFYFVLLQYLFYCSSGFMCNKIKYMLQKSCRHLQGYCRTHLINFIAHETTFAMKYDKPIILLQHLFYFISVACMGPRRDIYKRVSVRSRTSSHDVGRLDRVGDATLYTRRTRLCRGRSASSEHSA